LEIEKLLSILQEFKPAKNIKMIDVDKYGFSRSIQFEVEGEVYKIVWYVNESTLYYKNLIVTFHRLLNYKTFPARCNKILQFYRNEDTYPCCVLCAEKY
jgi:hypothetical protein